MINLKQLNTYIPYCRFKMKGLQNLKHMLQKRYYMYKLDLKDAYFSVPLKKNSRHFVRFRWSGNLYKFLCLCFSLGLAPRIFTKLLKVPMKIVRRINIKIIIYLEDMTRLIGLLMWTIQVVLPARLNCLFPQMQQISSYRKTFLIWTKLFWTKTQKSNWNGGYKT